MKRHHAPICGLCLAENDRGNIFVIHMMTSSNENIFRVTGPLRGEFTGPGEFPAQRPVPRSFDVLFDLRLNKRLSKQPWGWWFETPVWSLWRHRNEWQISKVRSHRGTYITTTLIAKYNPDSKVHGTNMGPIWGRQDPCGPTIAPWLLLSGNLYVSSYRSGCCWIISAVISVSPWTAKYFKISKRW